MTERPVVRTDVGDYLRRWGRLELLFLALAALGILTCGCVALVLLWRLGLAQARPTPTLGWPAVPTLPPQPTP